VSGAHRRRRRPTALLTAGIDLALAAAWAVLTATVGLVGYTLAFLAVGWHPAVVTSGSMAPALRPGDVVLFEPATEPVGPGAIVLFTRPGSGQLVVHRVAAVRADSRLVTKGDANPTPDSALLAPAGVRGRVRLVVPYVGVPRLLASTYRPTAVCWLLLVGGSGALVALVPYRRFRPR